MWGGRNLRGELIQRTHKTAICFGGINAPQWHAQLQLWHSPKERIDGLNNLLRLCAALGLQAAQSCVQRDATHSCRKGRPKHIQLNFVYIFFFFCLLTWLTFQRPFVQFVQKVVGQLILLVAHLLNAVGEDDNNDDVI